MATPLENNYLSNFDLEFLLGPASTVDSLVENTGLSNYVNQEINVHEVSLPQHVDNEGHKLKSDYESLKIHCTKLENDHDLLKNDYKGLKNDYTKLALDYASLQKENRDHAMASINNAKKFDNMELQANQYLTTINKLKNQCEIYEINIASQESNIKQFQCLVQELTTANEDLKKNIRTERATVRDGRKIISTLNSNNETLTEHLCILGCVIQGRKKLDRDIRRYIKKYCKKNTSPKESEESFECKSVDTGRGSSLAFSDGDRSFYSPAYSSNFSPLSTCSTILRNEQTKQMKDASTSPLPITKSLDKSTSPIMFHSIDLPIKDTWDRSTSPIIFGHAKSTECTLNASLMPISPISINGTRMPMLSARTAEITLNTKCVEPFKIQPEKAHQSTQKITQKVSDSKCMEDKAPKHITKPLSDKAKNSLIDKVDIPPEHKIEILEIITISPKFSGKPKKPIHTETSGEKLISNSIFEDTTETPQRMDKILNECKSSELADEFNTSEHMTDMSNDATYSLFGEDPETPQYIEHKPDNSTSVIEFKKPRGSSEKVIHSIFDEDSPYDSHKDKKTIKEPTNSIPTKGAKSPQHWLDTMNTGTISDKGPETLLHHDKPINGKISLQQSSKTFHTVTNSVEVEKDSAELMKQTCIKVTNSILSKVNEIPQQKMKTPDIPRKLMLDNEVKIRHSNEIPQITLTVFNENSQISHFMKTPDLVSPTNSLTEENEIPQPKMITPDIPLNSIFKNEVKTQHSTELPHTTLSVFGEESEISQTIKTPDSASPLYSENVNGTERHNTKISRVTPTVNEGEKSPLRSSETSAMYPMSENSPSRNSSSASYYSTDYEDRDSPLTLSECPNNETKSTTCAEDKITSTNGMNNKISDKLNEIDSQVNDNLQDDKESNLEIQMILDMHRLNLIMISPMSVTPDPDQENESSKLENEVSADKIDALKPKISSQILDKPNEYATIKDTRCKSRNESESDDAISVNRRDQQPRQYKNINKNKTKPNENEIIKKIHSKTSNESESDDVISVNRRDQQRREYKNNNKNKTKPNEYEIIKETHCESRNDSESDNAITFNRRNQRQRESININNNVDTPPNISVSELSENILTKDPGIVNNKKLRGLRKQYQINVPKQVSTPSLQKHLRWTPYPIPVVNPCPDNLSLNKEKAVKIIAELKEKQLSKEKVTKGKGSMASYDEKIVKTKTIPGSVANIECGIRIKTKPKLESGLKSTQLAVCSQAKDQHEFDVSQNISSRPEITEKLKISDKEYRPEILATTLFEPSRRRSSRLSINPKIAPIQTLPNISENLPELKNKCPPATQTESLPEIGSHSEKQMSNAKVSQLQSQELYKGAETNLYSISATQRVLPQTDLDNTNEIKGKTNPEEADYLTSPPPKKIRISHIALENSRNSGNKRRLCISPQHDDKSKKSNLQSIDTDCNNKSQSSATSNIPQAELDKQNNNHTPILLNESVPEQERHCADYDDINLFLSDNEDIAQKELKKPANNLIEVKDLLSTMLEKYASVSHGPHKKEKEDPIVNDLAIKIESGVSNCEKCRANPEEYKKAINEFVSAVKSRETKIFVNGLLKYLNNPVRKAEIPKIINAKAPPIITHSEQTLIDVIVEVQKFHSNVFEDILDNIEFTLFSLDKGATPVFDIVESMAHFFAAICNYFRNVSRLRMFMLNALYCISFKAMPLIKQCLDVYPTALPYGNMVSAKSPLIRCFVFMLHFYACDDPFKKVQELRDKLKYKYNYNLVDENESTILFMFKSAIEQLTENKTEKEMLRISLIVLAKRRGTSWCHKNIVQKILLPMVKGQIPVSDTRRRFCIMTLGPLLRPYKKEMMVHREEVVNLLTNILMESQHHELKEDILTSLITIDSPTTWEPVNKYLIQWTPPAISPAFEEVLKRYIRKRHVSKWKYFYIKYYSEV